MQELENVPGIFFDPVYFLNCDMYKMIYMYMENPIFDYTIHFNRIYIKCFHWSYNVTGMYTLI